MPFLYIHWLLQLGDKIYFFFRRNAWVIGILVKKNLR